MLKLILKLHNFKILLFTASLNLTFLLFVNFQQTKIKPNLQNHISKYELTGKIKSSKETSFRPNSGTNNSFPIFREFDEEGYLISQIYLKDSIQISKQKYIKGHEIIWEFHDTNNLKEKFTIKYDFLVNGLPNKGFMIAYTNDTVAVYQKYYKNHQLSKEETYEYFKSSVGKNSEKYFTLFYYDLRDNLIQKKTNSQLFNYHYNLKNQIIKIESFRDGKISQIKTDYKYDSLGNIIKYKNINKQSDGKSFIDFLTIEYEYDNKKNWIKSKLYSGDECWEIKTREISYY